MHTLAMNESATSKALRYVPATVDLHTETRALAFIVHDAWTLWPARPRGGPGHARARTQSNQDSHKLLA